MGFLGYLSGLVVADMGVQRCHEHQRIGHIAGDLLTVRLDPDDAVIGEGVAGVGEETDGMEEIVDDDRLEDIQFKVSLRGGDTDGGIVSHDLHGDHGDGLALRGIDLAGHDGGAGLILRQGELAETATGARGQPPEIVGDLHERGGQGL